MRQIEYTVRRRQEGNIISKSFRGTTTSTVARFKEIDLPSSKRLEASERANHTDTTARAVSETQLRRILNQYLRNPTR